MSIEWQGFDAQLDAAFVANINARLGPLPDRYRCTSGYRSVATQNRLFAQGRDAAGNVVDTTAVVTNARGGQSAHNSRLAADIYPIIAGAPDFGWYQGQQEPSPTALPKWQAFWNALRADPSLYCGIDFPRATNLYDPGHVEVRNWRLLLPVTVPADPTALPTGGGGGASPTSDGGPSDGSPPSPSDADPTDGGPVLTYLQLDPGVAIGAAAIAAAVVLLWLRRRAGR